MSDGRETSGMEDKAVSTVDDFGEGTDGYFGEGTHWNAVTIQKLLTVLINNKIMAMRAMNACEYHIPSDKSDSSEYSREKEPPDKRSPHHHPRRHQHHHHRHCPKHGSHHEERSSSISKVQRWSEDLDMDSPEDVIQKGRKSKRPKGGYLVVDIESGAKSERPPKRRKRKKRKKSATVKKKVSQVDPEDLPTRARWTIIITSGLLILTCMFLVGVTLRMAPVIDQMVRTKNEELMNSLNRNNDPAYYSSFNISPY